MHKSSSLAISIVTYAPSLPVVQQTLSSLNRALGYARHQGVLGKTKLCLVDNGPGEAWREGLQGLLSSKEWHSHLDALELLSKHGNPGYGAGHNLAISRCNCEFYLVLNPDVVLEEDALFQALTFMKAYPSVGLLAPAARNGKGDRQYLCKRYPSMFDLLLRGFAPAFLKKCFSDRLNYYELRDLLGDAVVWDVPIVSGCFMLFRHSVLAEVQGFSPAYFMYFEDFDLSLRLARVARIVYVPMVRIIHMGGHAANKGGWHISLFLRSALTFFNRHGWKWR